MLLRITFLFGSETRFASYAFVKKCLDQVIAWVPQPVYVEEAVPMTKEENGKKGKALGKG